MANIPRRVLRKILRLLDSGEKVVVVVARRKIPSRVFSYEKYQKMKDLPNKVKPWVSRRAGAAAADPLGAVEGRVLRPIRREEMYE